MVSPKKSYLDEKWDWREHGLFKDDPPSQRETTGWAYATVAAIEANLQMQGLFSEELSVQNLIDCCFLQGGIKRKTITTSAGTLAYIRDHGITTAAQYPTLLPPDAAQGICKRCRSKKEPKLMEAKVKIKKFIILDDLSESGLINALKKTPLIVTICVDKEFDSYKKEDNISKGKGFFAKDLKNEDLYLHYLILVGYDTEKGANGEADEGYWILRNSYGTSWGDNGYIKLHRDQTCKFSLAVYPVEAYHLPPAPAP